MAQRIAYVTGGMGGIGTAICRRLAREGHIVIAGASPITKIGRASCRERV